MHRCRLRQIYGGIGMGVAALALINVFALLNVSPVQRTASLREPLTAPFSGHIFGPGCARSLGLSLSSYLPYARLS